MCLRTTSGIRWDHALGHGWREDSANFFDNPGLDFLGDSRPVAESTAFGAPVSFDWKGNAGF